MKKRLFGLLLTVCLVVGIMPTAAFAADGDKMMIMSGTSGIESPTPSAESGNIHYTPNSYIYFGAKSDSPLIRWRVLDANWANDKSTPAVFLLSENLVAGLSLYKGNGWQGSDAQEWCQNFASNSSYFSEAEQNAMLGIAKTDDAESLFGYAWGESSLTTDDKMFFLSAREVADYVANYNGASELKVLENYYTRAWWLRSCSNNIVGYVNDGVVNANSSWYNSYGVRPAFNLDLDAVLFTSASNISKPNGLQEIKPYTGDSWKLTLLDSSRDKFTIGYVQRNGNNITVYYSGATAGANEYISALVADSTGAFTHYGKLGEASSAGGASVTFALPELAEGSTVYIFNEQCNDSFMTDYASNLVELAIPEDSEDGREVELRNNGDYIQWKYVDEPDTAWRDLVALDAITGGDGADGREVQLRVDGGYIQWKYDTDADDKWENLISLSELKGEDGTDGREVELKNDGNSILWRYVGEGDDAWQSLVDLSDITGSDGTDGKQVELRVEGGYIQWKYDADSDWQNLIALSALQGIKGDKGDKGDPGEDGDTPYIGDNGNWWIGGVDTGTPATGADGANGQDGQTPTIGTNGNWWIGGVDTGIPATGSDGADGQDGQDGKDGEDGQTPYVGSNGNWWIGTTDTGISAMGANGAAGQNGAAGANGAAGTNGADGQDGADGVGIANIEINENGELIVTLTDGTEKNLGNVQGADGAGISGVSINENGELVFTLTDGTELNAGVVRTAETAAAMGSTEIANLKTLVYVSVGIAGVSLAGMIGMLVYMFAKRKVPIES